MKTIIIIEDNEDISEGFKLLINATQKYFVSHCFVNCEAAISLIKNIKPDIVLMDIDLPGGMNGIQGTSMIKDLLPKTEVIMITVFENSEKVFDALCAGATGYLTKNASQDELLGALDEISLGGAPMSANIARMVIQNFRKNTKHDLSDRELEVLQALVQGKTQKTIADNLFISLSTVKFHIKNIYEKLQVKTKEEAVTKAQKDKLV
ncbi:MAG: response regulator transcription factor [Cytophagales bacterium]